MHRNVDYESVLDIFKARFKNISIDQLKHIVTSHVQSTREISRVSSAESLFNLLEQRQLVHPQNIELLRALAVQLGFPELIQFVDDYQSQYPTTTCCNETNLLTRNVLDVRERCRNIVSEKLGKKILDAVVVHTDEDNENLIELFQCLKQWNVNFKSYIAIPPGYPIYQSIVNNIRRARYVLFFVTENFNSSRHYTQAARHLAMDDALKGKVTAIPVAERKGLSCYGWEAYSGVIWTKESDRQRLKEVLVKTSQQKSIKLERFLNTQKGQELIDKEVKQAENKNFGNIL